MAGDGSIFDFRRSLADGNGINDLALGVSVHADVPRAADLPLRSQMPNELVFQRSARFVGTGCDKSFRETRAGSHPWDTAASAIRKFVAATSPRSVYSQRSLAAYGGWPAGTAWAAGRMPRPVDRPRWLDTEV